MSDISSIGHHGGQGNTVGPLGRVNHSGTTENGRLAPSAPEQPVRPDRVELSEHARLLDQLRRMPDVRMDRIEAVRELIDAGVYETPDRLEAAIEKLLEDL